MSADDGSPFGMLPGLLATLYREAQAAPDVPDPDCGRTPLEHFVVQPDGTVRLRGECLHGTPITADRITVGAITADRLHAGTGDAR